MGGCMEMLYAVTDKSYLWQKESEVKTRGENFEQFA
jgi:hypothetical protein